MKKNSGPAIAFIAIGVTFLAIGSSGRRAFLVIGAAFIVIGLISLRRQRGSGSA